MLEDEGIGGLEGGGWMGRRTILSWWDRWYGGSGVDVKATYTACEIDKIEAGRCDRGISSI